MFGNWRTLERDIAMMNEFRRRMDRVFHDMDDHYGYAATTTLPGANLVDTGESFVVTAEVPGLKENDLKLSVHQNVLTLSGERADDTPEGYSVHRKERRPVKFSRSFSLTAEVDAEKVHAGLKNGLLTVTLPKQPAALPKQISIKVD